MYNTCSAYAERILSHTEHTRNEFHRMLSIRGTDFIACWAYGEMFKSRISRPNRVRFSKISCYRPLGPYGFGFCKKSQKKIFMLVYLKWHNNETLFYLYFCLYSTCFRTHTWNVNSFWIIHGLINYIDTKAKCRHKKIDLYTCTGTLRQVFLRVYRLEIGIFDPGL